MEINWLRPLGTITREEERAFPSLARRITFGGRCQLDYIIPFVFAWMIFIAVVSATPNHWQQAVRRTLKPVFLVFFVPAFLLSLPSSVRARRAMSALKAKGYTRFGPRLRVGQAAMIFDPKFLARIPPFSEIESTPYNNPNDPDALLRMLDDLAGQMDAPHVAAPPRA